MKKLLPILLLSLFIGCKGEKGPKGDTGNPGTITTYTGFVTSDTQLISISTYKASSDLSVFVGDGTNFTECPYYAPGLGLNVYYAAQPAAMTLYNAQTAAATHYKIVVINAAQGSSLGTSRLID
jgi:hypothetical protein